MTGCPSENFAFGLIVNSTQLRSGGVSTDLGDEAVKGERLVRAPHQQALEDEIAKSGSDERPRAEVESALDDRSG